MIASVLPLPLDPSLATTSSQTDLEQRFDQQFGPTDDKAFQKATWWRNLNRVMSGIGTLLIVAIVSSSQFFALILDLTCRRLCWQCWYQECLETRYFIILVSDLLPAVRRLLVCGIPHPSFVAGAHQFLHFYLVPMMNHLMIYSCLVCIIMSFLWLYPTT